MFSRCYIKSIVFVISMFCAIGVGAQPLQNHMQWKNVSSSYALETPYIQAYESVGTLHDSAFRAFYVVIDTKHPQIKIGTDTTLYRRKTPTEFFERLQHPTIVMNASFFEFKNNTNLNLTINRGQLLSLNKQDLEGRGKDTLTYTHVLSSALGMTKKGNLEVVYTYTDSNSNKVRYQQELMTPVKDSASKFIFSKEMKRHLKNWKVNWAVGGGPVLIKDGRIFITNNEERKFAGRAILDRHPRTAMGYTRDGKTILMVIQGRMKNIAVGTTLEETAKLLLDLGCVGAINLDGGGSSCLLVNGKETIKPSDATGQRPIPAVFYVQ